MTLLVTSKSGRCLFCRASLSRSKAARSVRNTFEGGGTGAAYARAESELPDAGGVEAGDGADAFDSAIAR